MRYVEVSPRFFIAMEANISDPYCNKFEVVSPILNATTNTASTSNDDCGGNGGLDDCKTILCFITEISSITLNASMTFHVHVNSGHFNLEQIKNVCLNNYIIQIQKGN